MALTVSVGGATLALAWAVNVIVCFGLLRLPLFRPSVVKWLTTTLILWLCITFVVVGTLYAYGTAYPYGTTAPTLADFLNLIGGSAYFAAGLSFGCILAPILLLRATRKAMRLL